MVESGRKSAGAGVVEGENGWDEGVQVVSNGSSNARVLTVSAQSSETNDEKQIAFRSDNRHHPAPSMIHVAFVALTLP